MNFDELKNDWNKLDAGQSDISTEMLSIKAAQTPVDKIRSKMKHEFKYQLLGLLVLAFTPRIFGLNPEIKPVFVAFYSVGCGFTAYYFARFYIFYKSSYDMSLDTRKNLLWFYYEMKINIELYKSLTYILGFISLSFFSTYMFVTKGSSLLSITKYSMVSIIVFCFFGILIMGLITELWVKVCYGKQVAKIKEVLDKLDDE